MKEIPVKFSCDLGKVPVEFLLEFWNKICPIEFSLLKGTSPLKFSFSWNVESPFDFLLGKMKFFKFSLFTQVPEY